MGDSKTGEMAAEPFSPEMMALLRRVPLLDSLKNEDLQCLSSSRTRALAGGEVLLRQGDESRNFWMLLQGRLRVELACGEVYGRPHLEPGLTFGEVPLLAGIASPVTIAAEEPSLLLELTEDQFWALMNRCPMVRRAILGNMALRFQRMQTVNFQQEKMASLGTLSAGLMHELKNPGSAARRAASQLRQNLLQLQRLGARFTERDVPPELRRMMVDLQERAIRAQEQAADRATRSSLEQADAEEAMAEWLESHQVEDAWRVAPELLAAGLEPQHLEALLAKADQTLLNDSVHWLGALSSSLTLVGAIEASMGRVTDLVLAVKSYAYGGQENGQGTDIKKTIYATVLMLSHKLRDKGLSLKKELAPDLPPAAPVCKGIGQILTNVLDNAIYASPHSAEIGIRTWLERLPDGKADICIAVIDHGEGITAERQAHIFDQFYTTKPVGVGTGLGLEISLQLAERCGGSLRFASVPGKTEFVLRVPALLG